MSDPVLMDREEVHEVAAPAPETPGVGATLRNMREARRSP